MCWSQDICAIVGSIHPNIDICAIISEIWLDFDTCAIVGEIQLDVDTCAIVGEIWLDVDTCALDGGVRVGYQGFGGGVMLVCWLLFLSLFLLSVSSYFCQ